MPVKLISPVPTGTPARRRALRCLAFGAGLAWAAAAGVVALTWPVTSAATEFQVAGLRLVDPKATPSRPGSTSSAAYLTIVNRGPSPDRLLRASSTAAAAVEIHTMKMDGDVMRMREIDAIDVPSGQTVSMGAASADGYHLMLLSVRKPLKIGDSFPLVLEFQHAGRTEVTVLVAADARGRPAGAGADHGGHGGHNHGAAGHKH